MYPFPNTNHMLHQMPNSKIENSLNIQQMNHSRHNRSTHTQSCIPVHNSDNWKQCQENSPIIDHTSVGSSSSQDSFTSLSSTSSSSHLFLGCSFARTGGICSSSVIKAYALVKLDSRIQQKNKQQTSWHN